MSEVSLIPVRRIERKILLLRGEKVMLDRDLAELYGVETKVLNQAVKRNLERFPADFMFQLAPEEFETLRFQNETSKANRTGPSAGRLRSQFVILKNGGPCNFRPAAYTGGRCPAFPQDATGGSTRTKPTATSWPAATSSTPSATNLRGPFGRFMAPS